MKAAAAALTAASLVASLLSCHALANDTVAQPAAANPRVTRTLAEAGIAPYPQFPALSPDGSCVVFSWAGDLWAARLDWNGGKPSVRETLRLTAHPGDERRSAFSPDGSMLAFESNRDGARNLYVMPLVHGDAAGSDWLAAGAPRRVTCSDAAQTLGGFTQDGSALLFSANQEPTIYRQSRLYRAPLNDESVTRVTDAYGFAPHAAADASGILFSRGYASALERTAYRGSGNLDLYRLSGKDGSFTRVTSNPANDVDAYQAPDGRVYFVSSRAGEYNLFRFDAGKTDDSGGNPTQLTRFAVQPGQATIGHGVRDLALSADGTRAAFIVWDTLYVMDLTARDPKPEALAVPLTADTALLDTQRINLDKSVTEAALSPDGKTLALIARGEVFVRSTEEGRPTRRVTDTPGRERDLVWSPDGQTLYFSSDQPGVYALYTATVTLTRDDIEPKEKPAKPEATAPAPAPAAGEPAKQEGQPGDAPKPEQPKEPAKEQKKEPKIDHGKRWAESLLFDVKPLLTPAKVDQRSPAPSPDGKKLLYTRGRGDLMLVELGTMQERVLFEGWEAPDALWAPDSRHIVYAVSDLDYNSDIWLLDTGGSDGATERRSDAGKQAVVGSVPGAINLTQHPDNDVSPWLSADGKVLVFLSERAGQNNEFDVWQVYLDKKLEGLKPYELDEYYKKASEAAGKRKPLGAPAPEKKSDGAADAAKDGAKEEKKDEKKDAAADKNKPLTFDADDAYLRVRRVTSQNVSGLAITPAADRILFSAAIDTERSLYSVDRKGEDRKLIQAGTVSALGMSLTGDKATFVRAGAAFAAPPKGGKVDAYPIDAPVVLDVPQQQKQKFLEAARILGTQFYNLKGLDWDALTQRYLDLAMKTRTNEEFDRVADMLFGELDGSHVGITSPATYTTTRPGVGVLGADVEPVTDGYRVKNVLRASPADQQTSKLETGDVIIAVDGRKLAQMTPLPDICHFLAGKAGKETLLEVRRGDGADATTRHILIVPATAAALNDIGYQDQIRRRREKVEELSAGKLGYLHIRAMGDASVRDFERDLYAAAHGKAGLIIDVRDNGGGYTTDILLASLTAPSHARTFPRGVDPATLPPDAYPRDRRLIYAYSRPINVLINENSFSNAEVFAHAIQNIKRGTLVGTPTFGGVISTGATTLLDGTTVRTPGRGWIMPDGNDMENHGAQPEVNVPQTPADEVAGKDPQLEAAVKELMGRVSR